ncbi:reverse transcriptase domain-containing protein [Tanacetum coccineum]
MVSNFLSKYYPYSKALQLRKDILNLQQLPTESVFEAWERFKSCLRKCLDHKILLIDQILTFYQGITMIDWNKIMWEAKVYYDTTTGVSAHYSETTSTLSAQIESNEDEPLKVDKSEIDPLIRESLDSFLMGDEEIELYSHEDHFYKMLKVQKSIHPLSGSPTPSSDHIVASPSPSLTPFEDSDFLLEETDAFLALDDSIPPNIDNRIYDSEGDILFLEKLLEDEPSEAKNSEIDPLIREPSDTLLMGDTEIKFNPLKDIDDFIPILKVSEKPLDSLDLILKTFDMTITNPLFDFDSEFTFQTILSLIFRMRRVMSLKRRL